MNHIFKFILFALLVILLTGCLQPVPPEKRIYQEIIETNTTKNESYEKTKMWLSTTFNDSKSVIEYDNKEKGIIIGQGVISNIYYGLAPVKTRFTLKIEIKESKSRMTFSDMVGYGHNIYDFPIENEGQMNTFKKEAQKITSSYKIFFSEPQIKNDW